MSLEKQTSKSDQLTYHNVKSLPSSPHCASLDANKHTDIHRPGLLSSVIDSESHVTIALLHYCKVHGRVSRGLLQFAGAELSLVWFECECR